MVRKAGALHEKMWLSAHVFLTSANFRYSIEHRNDKGSAVRCLLSGERAANVSNGTSVESDTGRRQILRGGKRNRISKGVQP